MTSTPPGIAEHQGERRLGPGFRNGRELVEQDRRERLLAAMVTVVAERGYETTRVADVLEASGVSRNAFYKIFSSKHDCFLAALDGIVGLSGPSVLDVYWRTPGTWEERMGAMLASLGRLIATQPAVARVAWIEVYAAGPEAVERIDEIDRRVEKIVRSALSESPERKGMPPDVVRAMIGGIRKIVHTRVREGREAELPELMPALLDWILSYRAPSERLRRPRKPPAGLVPDAPDPIAARDRIVTAVIELVAEKGYPNMAITEIADRGALSLTTFYAHFDSKEAAFLGAIEHGWRRALDAVMPAYRAGADWPHAMSAGVHAFFALFALNPPLGRVGAVDAYEGGPGGLERRDQGIAAAQLLLQEGHQLNPSVPPIASQAIGASIYALLSRQIRDRGAERLYEVAPAAAFIALAPFLGSEDAVAVANAVPPVGEEPKRPWPPRRKAEGGSSGNEANH